MPQSGPVHSKRPAPQTGHRHGGPETRGVVCLPQDHCSGDPGCHRQPSPGLVHPPLGGHLAGWLTERSNPFQQERNHLPITGEENRPVPCPLPSCLLCPLGLIRSEEAARLLSEARPGRKEASGLPGATDSLGAPGGLSRWGRALCRPRSQPWWCSGLPLAVLGLSRPAA